MSFIEQRRDERLVPELIKILNDAKHPIPEVLNKLSGGGRGGGGATQFGSASRTVEDHRENQHYVREAGQQHETGIYYMTLYILYIDLLSSRIRHLLF